MALTCRTLIGVALPALIGCSMMLFSAEAQELEIATAVSALEGPTVDRDGNVYFSERSSQRIMKLSKEGVLSTYRETQQCVQWSADRPERTAHCV